MATTRPPETRSATPESCGAATDSATVGSSCIRRSLTRTRATGCSSSCSPVRGRTQTSCSSSSAPPAPPMPTSRRRSPPTVSATVSCDRDACRRPTATVWSRSPRRSCSHRSTKASARRCSRRWRSAPRWCAAIAERCPRSSATPASCSRRPWTRGPTLSPRWRLTAAELVERGRLRAARFTTAESGSALAAAYRAAGGRRG